MIEGFANSLGMDAYELGKLAGGIVAVLIYCVLGLIALAIISNVGAAISDWFHDIGK